MHTYMHTYTSPLVLMHSAAATEMTFSGAASNFHAPGHNDETDVRVPSHCVCVLSCVPSHTRSPTRNHTRCVRHIW